VDLTLVNHGGDEKEAHKIEKKMAPKEKYQNYLKEKKIF
jgi:hypothetical protein